METSDDEKLLADVAALVCAIDSDDVAASSPLGVLILDEDAGASLRAPFEGAGDEWLLFDDVLNPQTARDATKTEPAKAVLSAPTNSRVRSHPTTSNGRVKACRDRQKAELAYLRDRVGELEQQLRGLKLEKRASNEPTREEEEAQDGQLATRDGVKHFWQRQAEGERRARERSIAENARLRQSLEGQLRVAKSLARLLRKRPSDTYSLSTLTNAYAKRNRLHDAEEAEIYEYLMRDMDLRYTQVDKVLRESGLRARQATFEDARFVESKGDHPWFLEFVDSTIVPFEYDLVRDVTWRALCTPTVPLEHGVYEVIEATSDVIKAEFRIQMHIGNSEVLGRGRFVTRRYTEENRQVLVSAVWSTTEGGLLCDQQVRLVEEDWGIVCPHGDQEQEQEQSLSLIQRCGRMRPNMSIKKSSKLEAHVGVLTDVLLGTYHDILRGLNDHMGRMMVEAAATSARDGKH